MPSLRQVNCILLLILECLDIDIRESSSGFVGSTFYGEKKINDLKTESKKVVWYLKNKNRQSITIPCLK